MAKRERRSRDKRTSQASAPARRSLGWVLGESMAMAEALRRERALEASLRAVTQASVRMTRSYQATLRLLDDSGKRLLTSARSGPSVHRRGNTPFRLGEGFIGWVVVHRRPAMINAVRSDPRFVARTGQLWTPTGIMAVPLLTAKGSIGVLSVSRKEATRYRQNDLQILELIAQLSVPYLEIARLERLNESDPLTLLHNRRHLQHRLPQEIHRAGRRSHPLAVAMIDLDLFKRINDTHGHDVGDEVLLEVADRLRRASRTSDVVARWGGEEFLALFPETSIQQAGLIAERIRGAIAERPVETSAGPIRLTASIGLSWSLGEEEASELERRADQALLEAKRKGRDRVEVHPHRPKAPRKRQKP